MVILLFKYEKIKENVYILCDFYRINESEFNELCELEEYKELTPIFAEVKDRFVYGYDIKKNDSAIRTSFSRALIYEVKNKKHMYLYTLDEFKALFEWMIERGTFSTIITWFNCVSIYSAYTEWAYNNMLRDDYYITSDITSMFKLSDVILQSKQVYTIKEMESIADSCSRFDTQIFLRGMTEGLTSSDITSLLKSDFESKENHPIILESGREFNMSDKLYEMCRKYSMRDTVSHKFIHNDGRERKLTDSKYLIRPIDTVRAVKDKKFAASQFATVISNDVGRAGVKITPRIFRNYSMCYYTLTGMPLDEMNKKFGTKYQHASLAYRNLNIEEDMKRKIEEERNEED